MTTRLQFETSDGLHLDGRLDGPDTPSAVVVWCHPHPLHGGSMFAPLMNAVTDGVVSAGLAVIRFSFRGVGDSDGRHAGGRGEVDDVAAVVGHASTVAATVVLAGWSFGAAVALRYLLTPKADPALRYVGVAPPTDDLPPPSEIGCFRAGFVVGSRDQVVDASAVERYAREAGAELTVVRGADHFFTLRSRPIVDAISRPPV